MRTAIGSPSRWQRFAGLMRAAWAEYERDHARYFAGAMVYYALVSLVPLVLLVLAVIGLLLRFAEFAGDVELRVLHTVDARLGPEVGQAVADLLGQLQLESVVATIVSLVALTWAASGLFRHLRLSFRAIWKQPPPLMSGRVRAAVRAAVVEFAIAYVMVLAGGMGIVLSLVFVSVTQWLGGLVVELPIVERAPAWVLALPGSVVVVGVTFALLFRFLPPVPVPWRHVWFATALCTGAWVVGAEIVVLLGLMFGRSLSASNAFGGVLLLMLWVNVVSQLLFFGAEICKVEVTGLLTTGDRRPVA